MEDEESLLPSSPSLSPSPSHEPSDSNDFSPSLSFSQDSKYAHFSSSHSRPPSLSPSLLVSLSLCEIVLMIAFAYAFNRIVHNWYCGFLFQCGCTWDYQGGWANCNVHHPDTPSCPFCDASPSTVWLIDYLTVFLVMAVCYLMVFARQFLTSRRHADVYRPLSFLARFVTPVIVFFAYNAIMAFFFDVGTGYPYFMWFKF